MMSDDFPDSEYHFLRSAHPVQVVFPKAAHGRGERARGRAAEWSALSTVVVVTAWDWFLILSQIIVLSRVQVHNIRLRHLKILCGTIPEISTYRQSGMALAAFSPIVDSAGSIFELGAFCKP